jgi:DNA-binding LacI/PurR family transcriptional regulator
MWQKHANGVRCHRFHCDQWEKRCGSPKKTRQRVLDAAKELNYQPDLNARSSKEDFLHHRPFDPRYHQSLLPQVVRGITDKANALGYHVILFNSDNELPRKSFLSIR